MIDKKIKFEIEIKLIKGYQKIINLFHENLMVHLIRKCDMKVKQIQETINERTMITNIKFLGYCRIIVNRMIVTNSIQEAVRIIDTEKSEIKFSISKYRSKTDFIDLEA